jgi:hypothetical protein
LIWVIGFSHTLGQNPTFSSIEIPRNWTFNDQVHRAAANDFRIQESASTAAPVQRIVMLLLSELGI